MVTGLHPDLQRAAAKSPSFDLNRWNLLLVRLALHWLPMPKAPKEIRVENLRNPDGAGRRNLRLRVYRPSASAAPTPVLLWFHGGGYVIGKPEMDDAVCGQYARELGIAVVSVDYRLAPGHPFPAGLEDGYAALIWVRHHADQLGIDRNRIAIGGASAGGGLAASLVQLAHDRGEVDPVFQLLVYPMLDDRTSCRTDLADTNHLAWSRKSNGFAWQAYLGTAPGARDMPDCAVPARRTDLAGLPPAWVGVGSLDLFHDEDVAYAQRLRASGGACDLLVVPGAFHGFDVFTPDAPVVKAFRAAQIAALKKHLFPSGAARAS